jgi:hypothetical protein
MARHERGRRFYEAMGYSADETMTREITIADAPLPQIGYVKSY